MEKTMCKFDIRYTFHGGDADEWRGATVFARSLQEAVDKINKVDDEITGVVRANFVEYPNWKE